MRNILLNILTSPIKIDDFIKIFLKLLVISELLKC